MSVVMLCKVMMQSGTMGIFWTSHVLYGVQAPRDITKKRHVSLEGYDLLQAPQNDMSYYDFIIIAEDILGITPVLRQINSW